jgi:hypothetical protein
MTKWRVEYALSGVFAFLTALTAVVPDWIEEAFKISPDAGSGSLEWVLVAVFGLAAVVTAGLARRHQKVARNIA